MRVLALLVVKVVASWPYCFRVQYDSFFIFASKFHVGPLFTICFRPSLQFKIPLLPGSTIFINNERLANAFSFTRSFFFASLSLFFLQDYHNDDA